MTAPARLLPRLMKAANAAAYLDMSVSKFQDLVRAGDISPPRIHDNLVRWDVRDLDSYADNLPYRGQPANDGWKLDRI